MTEKRMVTVRITEAELGISISEVTRRLYALWVAGKIDVGVKPGKRPG